MRTSLLGCLLSVLLLIGCGSPTGFVPVSGKVTMDGKPLDDAHVSFEPNLKGTTPANTPKNSPGGSYAITDAQGRFRLKRVTDDASGAAVGEHIVTISKYKPLNPSDDAAPVLEQVPAKYRDGTLKFSVPAGGTDKADFELSSK